MQHARLFAILFLTVLPGLAVLHAEDAATVSRPFTITLPPAYGEFTKKVQTASSPEGTIETSNWIARASTGEAVIVSMSDLPAQILDPQKLITSTRASLLQNLGATLEREEPRGEVPPSVRLLFRSDAALFRARFTVVDDRFYQLLYIGRSEEQRTAPAVSQIFDSFRITASPDAPPAS